MKISSISSERPASFCAGRLAELLRSRFFMISLVAAAIAVGVCGPGSSVTKAEDPSSPNPPAPQAGLDFYKGKTITFISPSRPGGGIDSQVRALAPYLGTYLHAAVRVESIPAGNTIGGQNAAAAARPDGLTLGYLNTLNDLEHVVTNTPGLSFNVEDVNIVLGAVQTSYTWVVSTSPKCSNITNWETFLKAGTESEPVLEITEANGSTTGLAKLGLIVFGGNTRLISGYSTEAQLNQGFFRGDGCVIMTSANSIGPLVQGGKGLPIAITGPVDPRSAYAKSYEHVPTVAQLVETDARFVQTDEQKSAAKALEALSTGLGGGAFLPKGTPTERVLAMRAAAKWAAHNPEWIQEVRKHGNNPGYVSPEEARAAYLNALEAIKPFASLLN
jgi:tripartite-type tricarboxylate transporter receptor subunit TctC